MYICFHRFTIIFTSGEEYSLASSSYSPVGSWFTLVVVLDKVAGTLTAYRDGVSLGQVTSTMSSGKGIETYLHSSVPACPQPIFHLV